MVFQIYFLNFNQFDTLENKELENERIFFFWNVNLSERRWGVLDKNTDLKGYHPGAWYGSLLEKCSSLVELHRWCASVEECKTGILKSSLLFLHIITKKSIIVAKIIVLKKSWLDDWEKESGDFQNTSLGMLGINSRCMTLAQPTNQYRKIVCGSSTSVD